ncbi:MAG: ABC transporter ATP-binding protein, partial [Chloroflexi bacterium]|nr:ABC transporter ATP-binding protein [Chloroflexota bacterium]
MWCSMEKDTSIIVRGIGKRYNIGAFQERQDTLRDLIVSQTQQLGNLFRKGGNKSKKEEIWALRDVSFDVKQGQALGIIGRNGAGKSTLLKILSRVTDPTEGYGELRG